MGKLTEPLIHAGEREQDGFVFVENREAVLAALKEGCCDGILPAARSFLDGFSEFCLRLQCSIHCLKAAPRVCIYVFGL